MLEQKVVATELQTGSIPPQVKNLARRERELAVILYQEGPMTAKVIEKRLPRPLSNSALRSMLGRLCRKGILKRRKITGSHLTSDRRIPYIYSPAITPDSVRRYALKQLASDYFDNSFYLVARTLTEIAMDGRPTREGGGHRPSHSPGMNISG